MKLIKIALLVSLFFSLFLNVKFLFNNNQLAISNKWHLFQVENLVNSRELLARLIVENVVVQDEAVKDFLAEAGIEYSIEYGSEFTYINSQGLVFRFIKGGGVSSIVPQK